MKGNFSLGILDLNDMYLLLKSFSFPNSLPKIKNETKERGNDNEGKWIVNTSPGVH